MLKFLIKKTLRMLQIRWLYSAAALQKLYEKWVETDENVAE